MDTHRIKIFNNEAEKCIKSILTQKAHTISPAQRFFTPLNITVEVKPHNSWSHPKRIQLLS